jgi:hypothetical protein
LCQIARQGSLQQLNRRVKIIEQKRYSRDEIENRERMADRTEKSNYRAENKGGMRYRKKRGWHRERKSPIIELKIKEG